MPFFKGQKGLAGRVLGDWQLSGTLIMQSGQPVNITNSAAYPKGDYNAHGTTGDRPNNHAESVKRSGFSRADYAI